MDEANLIYDWNRRADAAVTRPTTVELDDETLRDGLQSPSVRHPAVEKKIEILHLMEQLGIDCADIGLPGAGPHVAADVLRLAQEIADQRMRILPDCAARTVIADIEPIIDIAQKVGRPIEVSTFIGSSPIRQYAEDWSLDMMLRATEEAVTFAVRHELPVMYVTEDTTRAHPETIRQLYTTAIRCGARRICVCDTVGHATPEGVRALITYVRQIVQETDPSVKIDWHGHQDRGLGVINSIAALEAGAHRLHGCALGIGERSGNTPMDQLLINLQLKGYINRDLRPLTAYCQTVSEACGVPIPFNYPAMGRDAFRTGTGVHAAAVIKAFKKGDVRLANAVYSGVPADLVGREQEIEIGPVSGKSNVIYWLEKRGWEVTDERVEKILSEAKRRDRILTEEEIMACLTA
ncbi:MAG: 2-isopropylmalate synthase [Acidobacteria bacterium]|nr:MAG: 2-isopropylmalate synthase [Acidobacteriota bacterium]